MISFIWQPLICTNKFIWCNLAIRRSFVCIPFSNLKAFLWWSSKFHANMRYKISHQALSLYRVEKQTTRYEVGSCSFKNMRTVHIHKRAVVRLVHIHERAIVNSLYSGKKRTRKLKNHATINSYMLWHILTKEKPWDWVTHLFPSTWGPFDSILIADLGPVRLLGNMCLERFQLE